MAHPLLSIEDLQISFGNFRAVNGISFTVNKGEVLALVGESGSGKSVTSLSLLGLLPRPPASYSGKALFSVNGEAPVDLLSINTTILQTIRGAQIAMIFQEPMTSLNPVMRCGAQVSEVLIKHLHLGAKEAKQRAIEWFEKVELPDPAGMYDRYPHQLSGGQKQRVMIAMAMCCKPSLLICDEPTTALDVTVQKTVLRLIRDLQQQENMGVIFITHDLGVVSEIADRVAILYKGTIVEAGPTASVFSNPAHPYTKGLIACRPALHGKEERLPVVSDFLEGKGKEIQFRKLVNPSNDPLIEVRNLTVRFPGKKNFLGKPLSWTTAVDEVSFDIYRGETLGLVGESGCGKSTLGRALLQLIEWEKGSIRYNGKELGEGKIPASFRQEVQLVFQDPYSSLNPRLTIGSAIAEPMQVNGQKNGKQRQRNVAGLLQKVNLPAAAAERYPHEFSGGQRQRIVIARALATGPRFLVCDESVSALDVSVQAQVLNLLNDLKEELGLTMLFISHDLSVVRYMCDRILVMQKGSIIERGAADDIYHHPQHPYTKSLIEAIPNLRS